MLYVTELGEYYSPFGAIERLLPLRKKIFNRVIFAPSASSEWRTDEIPDLGVPFKTKTIRDFSYRQIMTAAQEEQVSCIAVDLDGSSHEATLRELALKSPLPVLVLNRGRDSDAELLNHVIFATDWSTASERAMEHILALAEFIYELDIIHVISEKLTVKDMRELKERLEHTRKVCLNEGINAESHIYAGDVAEEIVTASDDYRGSIIVVGSNAGRSFMDRLFRKNKVCALIKSATVPVFVIPFAAEDD